MNLKTTLLLAILVAGGAAGAWYANRTLQPASPASPTVEFLEKLQPGNLTSISLLKGGEMRFVLERNGPEWSLPGKWPVRTTDVENIIKTLTTLRSRFAPVAIDSDTDLKDYGLAAGELLLISITIGDK